MTTFLPAYRLVVYQGRSQDLNEAVALQPVGGASHQDYFKVTTVPGGLAAPDGLTAAMLSHSGLTVFTAANCVNGDLGDTGWGTDSATTGATLQVDLGVGVARAYRMCRVYSLGAYAGAYDVEYSDNGSSWTVAAANLRPAVLGWTTAVWFDVGAHRYWRLRLTNTPGAGAELAELEFWDANGPGAWQPYLGMPRGRKARLDPLNKKLEQGELTFPVLDRRVTPGGSNAVRWLVAYFGDTVGQLRPGYLKVRAEESLDGGLTWKAFWTGRIVTLRRAGLLWFNMGVRDMAAEQRTRIFVGRPHSTITYASETGLIPVGVLAPFGSVPANTPIRGSVAAAVVGGATLPDCMLVNISPAAGFSGPQVPPFGRSENLVTQGLVEALAPDQVTPFGQYGGVLTRTPNFAGRARCRLKQLSGGSSGTIGEYRVGAVGLYQWLFTGTNGAKWALGNCAIQALQPTERGYAALPAAGVSCEFVIHGGDAVTADAPMVINDVHPVQLWQDILDGKYGYLWTFPERLPSGAAYGDVKRRLAYDAAKFAALIADTSFPHGRFIIRKSARLDEWVEKNICIPYNLAQTLDGEGRVVPINLALPSTLAGVPTITEADLAAVARDWDYTRAGGITRVSATMYTDYPIRAVDLAGQPGEFPRLPGSGLREVPTTVTYFDIGRADLGDQPHELDAPGYRTMEQEQYQNQSRARYLQDRLFAYVLQLSYPFGAGPATLPLATRRTTPADTVVGDLRLLQVPTVPDPATGQHGGTRLVRVLERTEDGPVLMQQMLDMGLAVVAGVPTIGTPTKETSNGTNGVTVTVTLNASGQPVELHFAVTATSVGTAPVEGSPLWAPIPPTGATPQLIRATGSVTFRGLPPGMRVWVRGRTMPDQGATPQLPSAWAAAATSHVDLDALTAPSALTVPGAGIYNRGARLEWTNGSATAHVEVLLATPTTDPRVRVALLSPGSTVYHLEGLEPSTTYRAEVRHVTDGGHMSAGDTEDFTTNTTQQVAPDIGGLQVITGVL